MSVLLSFWVVIFENSIDRVEGLSKFTYYSAVRGSIHFLNGVKEHYRSTKERVSLLTQGV